MSDEPVNERLLDAIRAADRRVGYDIGPGSDRWMREFLMTLAEHGLAVVDDVREAAS